MGELGIAYFDSLWDGISSVEFFDFGFTWDKFILGLFVVNISIMIIRKVFMADHSTGSGIGSKIGRNARKKVNREA